MATKQNLMALGVPAHLARRQGVTPVITSVGGATAGAALQVAGDQFLTVITASNSGSGLRLPSIGGNGANAGALLGDSFTIANALGASIQIYAANNALGSAVTIISGGAAAAGTTGVSVAGNNSKTFYPATVSTWVAVGGVSA